MIYTIENKNILVEVSSIGATITRFIEKETNTDIVLGFDTEQEYFEKRTMFGATIGRCANRIGNASFTINGETYHTTVNDQIHTLHGGEGISFREFELKEKTKDSISFIVYLKDKEDGFSGNVTLCVKYELDENKLTCFYEMISDQDTILNISNHSYFNLNPDLGDILNHELMIHADSVGELDETGLTKEEVILVDGTSFDFREYPKIEDNFKKNHPNLSGGGIDHNFVFENLEYKELLRLRNEKLELIISSDLPGCHIYTANYLKDMKGKYQIPYHKYYGIAIEPQFYPNAINYQKYYKPIVKKNEVVQHYITYQIQTR